MITRVFLGACQVITVVSGGCFGVAVWLLSCTRWLLRCCKAVAIVFQIALFSLDVELLDFMQASTT